MSPRRRRRSPSPTIREPRPDGPLADRDVPPGARVADCTVEGDLQAVGTARRFVRRQLAEWDVDDDTSDTAVLCLSELVTNAVIHAGASSELLLTLDDGMLTVAVRDHGGATTTAAEVVGDDDPMRVFGRGLVLVEALSDSWGSERDAVGTTSWFVLDLPDSARSAAS